MGFNIFKSGQQRRAEKRTKSLKKHIQDRKKDADIIRRHVQGKIIRKGEEGRLRRVLREQMAGGVRRDITGKKI